MSNQWENRGKELAAQVTDAAIARLEEELRTKQGQLSGLDEDLAKQGIPAKLTERHHLEREISHLVDQILFARDAVKPKVVEAAGKAGRVRDGHKGCFG